MADLQMKEFSGRLRRIEKIQRRGGGFEATGTLGQSHYTRLRSKRRPILRPAVVFVSAVLLFKGFLLAAIGDAAYVDTIVSLKSGGIVDQIGGWIMAPDIVSSTIAQLAAPLFG